MRKKQTPAEEFFWELVRDRRFFGLKFRRQHQFGDYILDFYCHEQRLSIELDGKVHDTRKAKDVKRDAYLASQGVKVIRISSEALLSNPESVLKTIRAQLAGETPLPLGEGRGEGRVAIDFRSIRRLLKQFDEERKAAVEQLKRAVYFHRQVIWLQARFPKAKLEAVPGLVKLVDIKEIEAADWSLTPSRYAGVSPPEEDEDLDFEQTLRDIHIELADLNKEAAEQAAKIQANFEELGI